ncbi:hypothetical protein GCM10009609_28730 [Pseudonocardia aurantiaca]|uniref:Uncharacterized protein n=1 Tax=Pseudonocardia aurantiaca TaxID=75290 RepID=A0ABW4FHS8_9PSEU
MPGGARMLERVFPGLLGELAADGAVPAQPLAQYRMRVSGHDPRPPAMSGPAPVAAA